MRTHDASLENQVTSAMTWYTTQSHYLTNQSWPYLNNAERMTWKRQVSILKLLVWLDEVQIPWSPKTGDGRSTRSAMQTTMEAKEDLKEDAVKTEQNQKPGG